MISPPFRVIWGSHRYVGMFFPILIQTSSALATWILLPVIITSLCLTLSNHTGHLKRRPLYQGLLYPGTMMTYTRQSFYAERQKENGRKQNGKLIFSYSRSGGITWRISLMRLSASFSRTLLRIIAAAGFRPRGRNPRRHPNVPRVK